MNAFELVKALQAYIDQANQNGISSKEPAIWPIRMQSGPARSLTLGSICIVDRDDAFGPHILLQIPDDE